MQARCRSSITDSLLRFLPEEEMDELAETRDHSDIPEAVEPRDDVDVTGDRVSSEGHSSVSVRTVKQSVCNALAG
jgi:hypothetical protein